MTALEAVYLAQAADPQGREHWSGPPEMVDRIARRLGTRAGHVVLDVGCGLGGPARRLAALTACAVVGIDVLEPVLRVARERSAGFRESVTFVRGSAERLPVGAGVVDQVWCLGALAHFPDRPRFAREVARVLRPGGKAAVTELFCDGRREPAFRASAPSPWHPVTPGRLAHELADAGLTHVEVLAWPGEGIAGALDVGDPRLADDLREGRLFPRLVVALKPDEGAAQETGPR